METTMENVLRVSETNSYLRSLLCACEWRVLDGGKTEVFGASERARWDFSAADKA